MVLLLVSSVGVREGEFAEAQSYRCVTKWRDSILSTPEWVSDRSAESGSIG